LSNLNVPGTCDCSASENGQKYCSLFKSDELIKQHAQAVNDGYLATAAYLSDKIAAWPHSADSLKCLNDSFKPLEKLEDSRKVYEECSSVWMLVSSLLILLF